MTRTFVSAHCFCVIFIKDQDEDGIEEPGVAACDCFDVTVIYTYDL